MKIVKTTGACSGECCRQITLSVPLERIAQLAAVDRFRASRGQPLLCPDAEFVLEHFIPTRMSHVHGATKEWLPKASQEYRCTAWDGRRCTKYDERPKLCRTYVTEDNTVCKLPRCTLRRVCPHNAEELVEKNFSP